MKTALNKEARARGQVLVLACVTMLTMALMLMLSFSVGTAVHERIRLQAYADAQAYSAAVIEARALNATAYMNRAIAASLVAQMGHHARWTVAESDVGMFLAAAEAFGLTAATEGAACAAYQFNHCPHAIKAGIVAAKFAKKYKEWKGKLDDKEQGWKTAVDSLGKMVEELHKNQRQMAAWARDKGAGNGPIFDTLNAYNAKHADLATDVMKMNNDSFDKVFEDNPDRKIMASVAMATRPKYEEGSFNGIHTANKKFADKNLDQELTTVCGANCLGVVNDPPNITEVEDSVTYIYTGGQTEGKVGDNLEPTGTTSTRTLTVINGGNPFDLPPISIGVVPEASPPRNIWFTLRR